MLNFILFKDLPLLYGRVPKVANSSIKAALSRLLKTAPQEGIRTTSDSFWKTGTNGETSMLSNHEARMLRGTHFSFSFVRNPFDRLVSAYNNKLLELATIPGRMKAMGLRHSMPFGDFLEVVASTRDDDLDVHLLPQSSILCLNGELIPNFIGHLETMQEDWVKLQQELSRRSTQTRTTPAEKCTQKFRPSRRSALFPRPQLRSTCVPTLWQRLKDFLRES